MSSDHQTLAAIAMKTGQEMRYFELVQATCGIERWNTFMCLGKHAIFFLRQDLNGKIHSGGELFYACILKVVQDSNTNRTSMFLLSDNKDPAWKSDRLFIRSDNREMLLKHLRCNWQTDHMWRVGRVMMFPLSIRVITKEKLEPNVLPLANHRWIKHSHYRHMLPYDFKEQPNSIQAENTGEYVNSDGVSLVVHVHETLSLDQLVQLKRDHIRWVAADYKVQLVQEESQFYILRNQQRQKRMNLSADIAAWYCWEIIIRTRAAIVICLPLRRQFIPPVCNCAQDLAVIMRCPADSEGRVNNFKQLLLDAQLIADSITPDAMNVAPYRDVVQAKLDALRFDEESFDWVKSHLKLNTKWQKYAKAFLRAIIEVYIKDNPRAFDSRLLEDLDNVGIDEDDYNELPDVMSKDLERIIEEMREPKEDNREPDSKSAQDDLQKQRVRNMWHARVARYFAWAVDGGLLQSKFTLDIMVENITALSEDAGKKASCALHFMLHMRLLDTTRPYIESPVVQSIRERNLKEWTFNDRVMQAILSQDYLRKRLGRQNETAFFHCLAHLLVSNAGTSLKASVCRIFMEMSGDRGSNYSEDTNLVVVPALMELLKTGGVFLATYASAALVNLSDSNQSVKMMLMSNGIATQAVTNIKTKDDELISYTLMLLVNLTKQPYHRSVIARGGLLPLLYDLLTSSYHQCGASSGGRGFSSMSVVGGAMKERLLTQAAILIGHFSIDESARLRFVDKDQYGYTVPCLLYMFDNSTPGSSLMSKTMFALKQLCKDRGDQKQNIGSHIIRRLKSRLADKEFENTSEFIFQSILLLQMLATHSTNCEIMDSCELIPVLMEVSKQPACSKIDQFDRRVQQLRNLIDVTVSKDYTMAD